MFFDLEYYGLNRSGQARVFQPPAEYFSLSIIVIYGIGCSSVYSYIGLPTTKSPAMVWTNLPLTEPTVLKTFMEGHNWFLNQFVEILRWSIIVGFLSLLTKARLNLPPFEISCSWPPSLQWAAWKNPPKYACQRRLSKSLFTANHRICALWIE